MPNPSQDTVTLTVTYSGMNAPQIMAPVTRMQSESDEALSARAAGYAIDYGTSGQYGKIASITAVWSA